MVQEIKEKIQHILQKIRNDDLSIENDVDFFETGLLDSYDLLSFITELEQSFSVDLLRGEVSPEHFVNINSIAERIAEKLALK